MKLLVHQLDVNEQGLRRYAHQRAADQPVAAQFGNEIVEVAGDTEDSVLSRRLAPGAEPREDRHAFDASWVHVVTQKGRLFNAEHPDVPVLFDRGRFQLVAMDPERARALADSDICFGIHPLLASEVVFEQHARSGARVEIPDWEQEIVDAIDPDGFKTTIDSLSDFHTRHSLSVGFAQATDSLAQQMTDLGYRTSVDPIEIFDRRTGQLVGNSTNLVIQKTGSGAATRGLVLVTAHLDSVNLRDQLDDTLAAPGADDNGSGSAGVVEIARVFAEHPCRDDLHFVLFGGEEQNLYGSTQYVQAMVAQERERLQAVINMDMVGVRNSEPPTVLLEGAPVSRHVIEGLAARADAHTGLAVRTSENPFASDHVPFIQEDLPAVLTIEGDDDQNNSIHTSRDVAQNVDPEYASEILKMNVGYIASRVGRTL